MTLSVIGVARVAAAPVYVKVPDVVVALPIRMPVEPPSAARPGMMRVPWLIWVTPVKAPA